MPRAYLVKDGDTAVQRVRIPLPDRRSPSVSVEDWSPLAERLVEELEAMVRRETASERTR